jgi:hypothetical protein
MLSSDSRLLLLPLLKPGPLAANATPAERLRSNPWCPTLQKEPPSDPPPPDTQRMYDSASSRSAVSYDEAGKLTAAWRPSSTMHSASNARAAASGVLW